MNAIGLFAYVVIKPE